MKILRTAVGFVCGYALMVVLITLVQETWFGGVSFGTTPPVTLALAGFFTCVAAGLGAAAAAAIGGSGRIPGGLMSGMVVVETTVLITTGRVSGPLWFDIASAGSLIVAILIGAEVFLSTPARKFGDVFWSGHATPASPRR